LKRIEEIAITELIPQRPPFVMVDCLLHFDRKITSGRLKIKPDNLFVENGIFTESGIIECITQTCAARMGYFNRLQQEETGQGDGKIKLGFIGAIKDLLIEKCPKVGDELKINIDVLYEVFTFLLVEAQINVGDERMASCEMRISITDIDSQ
jgi:3-hydroxymyristoyl/3-hydroxydecanoyl-(acyl carrier protein) dehydratase